MPDARTNLLQGTLDLLILKSLALGELHGLGVARRVEPITRGTFDLIAPLIPRSTSSDVPAQPDPITRAQPLAQSVLQVAHRA